MFSLPLSHVNAGGKGTGFHKGMWTWRPDGDNYGMCSCEESRTSRGLGDTLAMPCLRRDDEQDKTRDWAGYKKSTSLDRGEGVACASLEREGRLIVCSSGLNQDVHGE